MTMTTKKSPKRPGRPLKRTAVDTVQVHIVMPRELVKKIDVMAEKECRSRSSQVLFFCTEGVNTLKGAIGA